MDITIKKLAETIKEIKEFNGELKWNSEKPDGTPRKLLDVSRLRGLGWKNKIGLRDGIKSTYELFTKTKIT